MRTLLSLSAWLLMVAFSANALAEDVLRVGTFNWDQSPVNRIAHAKGFLERERIRVEFGVVDGSVELMRDFIRGRYDLIHTNADTIIAWAEGQGADPQPNDFIIFISGSRGVRRDLIVAPEVSSFSDLRGKVLAVDGLDTGYAPVLMYLLKKNGLTLNQDYTLKAIGNGALRAESMMRGETAGGFATLDDELNRRGFRKLAQTQDYISDFATEIAAARRDWADRNEELLVRYTRALVRSINWIQDPQNKEEAIAILASAGQTSPDRARQIYQLALSPEFGLVPAGRIDQEGIKQILQIREFIGFMKPPLPAPAKYIDEQFYQKALASLGRE